MVYFWWQKYSAMPITLPHNEILTNGILHLKRGTLQMRITVWREWIAQRARELLAHTKFSTYVLNLYRITFSIANFTQICNTSTSMYSCIYRIPSRYRRITGIHIAKPVTQIDRYPGTRVLECVCTQCAVWVFVPRGLTTEAVIPVCTLEYST